MGDRNVACKFNRCAIVFAQLVTGSGRNGEGNSII